MSSLATQSRLADTMSERLRRMLSGPDEEISLVEAALLIASHGYPDLNVAAYLSRIEELAHMLRMRIGEDATTQERIADLNQFLFGDLGFAANSEDYYDPRNSFINEVLERRSGIPITLSVIYMELGRKIGLPLQGVSFPGHFLVKCAVADGAVVLDPYFGGISLGLQDLQKRLRDVRGGEVSRAIVAELLVSASNKEIIVRLLRNLKAIYLRERDLDKALPIMNWIVATLPEQAAEVRDRGMIYQELECARAALNDFEAYLALAPGCEDVDDIRGRIVELRKEAARLN
ncbi:MAG: tetratricopeptide repeat protein [Betaproteobacteria bacterium]|jgi:regulator of sirC expression with transglutaminase-like and TPR domain